MMKRIFTAVGLGMALCLGLCVPAWATECLSVFPDPAASSAGNGHIRFQPGARLVGSDGLIDFATKLDNAGGFSCTTSACQLSGQSSASLLLPAFEADNSSARITVKQNRQYALSEGRYDEVRSENRAQIITGGDDVTYHIGRLHVGSSGLLELVSGVYWIDSLYLESNAELRLAGNGPVTLLVNELETSGNVKLNAHTDAGNLTILSYSGAKFGQYNYLKGFVYAQGTAEYGVQSQHYGAVSATEVVLLDSAQVHYQPDSIAGIDSLGLCESGNSQPTPIGHWPMDVCALSDSEATLIDIVGGNHGQALNSPSSDNNGKYCQAAYLRGVGDVLSIPHSDDYLLAEGSVSLWFNTDDLSYTSQASAGGMTLLSRDSAGLDGGGHLTIWLTQAGALKVQHQSASGSAQINTAALVTEDSWQHLVYTFGGEGMQLYLNGQQVGSNPGFTAGISGNAEPWILGGNAWQSRDGSSPVSELSDFYRGRLDDFRLYAQQLDADQISQLYAIESETCITCTSEPELVAHWKMDVCSLTGQGNEIIDVINGFNGTALGDSTAIPSGRFCQSAGFDGSGDYLFIEHDNAMQLKQGTLTFWMKAGDLIHGWRYLDGLQGVFARMPPGGSATGLLNISLDSQGRLVFEQSVKGKQKQVTAYTDALISENKWHHVAYSWGNDTLTFHVDGVYLGEMQADAHWSNSASGLLMAARADESRSSGMSAGHYFKGELDDVRLYEDVLTTADVQALFTASSYSCDNCEGSSPLLFYQFEQPQWSGEGDVTDSSGNDHHGTAVGAAEALQPDSPVSCRALSVPASYSAYQTDGVNTHLDINDVGSRGTISFWYRSNTPWQGGGGRQLLDASRSASGFDFLGLLSKYFFLSLNNAGQLTFGLEDLLDFDLLASTAPQGFAAKEWVHIAISWDVPGEAVELYLNGNSVPLYGSVNLVSSELGNLSELIIGDNSSRYLSNGSSGNSANGEFDDVRVYAYEQSRAEVRQDMQDVLSCSAVHHYQVSHPDQALTCSTAEVQITACGNESCSQTVTDPVAIELTNSQTGASQMVNFSAQTQVSLSHTEAGLFDVLITPLDNASAPAVSQQCSGNCQIEFVTAGFEFFDTATGGASLADIVAGQPLARIGLRAVEDNGQGACQALLQGEQSIQLGYDCLQTGEASYSPDQCRVNLAGITPQGNGLGVSEGPVTLTFDSNGETSLSGFTYADAGRLELSARAQLDDITIGSGSAAFDSIPAYLQLQAGAASPYTAGTEFTLTITAHGSNDELLPGYQPGRFGASLQRLIPGDANASAGGWVLSDSARVQSSLSGAFSDIELGDFEQGQLSYPQAYVEEVGSYQGKVQDSDYLGNVVEAQPVEFGPVIPAYFEVEAEVAPQFAATCSDAFTYVGQRFGFEAGLEPGFRITAYNARGQITQNYGGALWSLSPSVATLSNAMQVAHSSDYSGALSVVRAAQAVELSETEDFDGVGYLRILGSELAFEKLAAVSAVSGGSPFEPQAEISLSAAAFTDPDGVCFIHNYPGECSGYTVADVRGPQQRYGRLRLENTYGPENESLRVPLLAEYFEQGAWLRNTQDSCTDITVSLSQGSVTISNASSGELESDITAAVTEVSASGTLLEGTSGADDLVFYPLLDNQGQGVRGTIDVQLNPASGNAGWAEYLNIDWDRNGVIDDQDRPSATVSFGQYRGNDRTLYKRESLN